MECIYTAPSSSKKRYHMLEEDREVFKEVTRGEEETKNIRE
jgi:hypothetical protein